MRLASAQYQVTSTEYSEELPKYKPSMSNSVIDYRWRSDQSQKCMKLPQWLFDCLHFTHFYYTVVNLLRRHSNYVKTNAEISFHVLFTHTSYF